LLIILAGLPVGQPSMIASLRHNSVTALVRHRGRSTVGRVGMMKRVLPIVVEPRTSPTVTGATTVLDGAMPATLRAAIARTAGIEIMATLDALGTLGPIIITMGHRADTTSSPLTGTIVTIMDSSATRGSTIKTVSIVRLRTRTW
jgi:hypothetical protein